MASREYAEEMIQEMKIKGGDRIEIELFRSNRSFPMHKTVLAYFHKVDEFDDKDWLYYSNSREEVGGKSEPRYLLDKIVNIKKLEVAVQ
ncbi:hypothetical protein J4474_03825 [Candidatus Pacearchaeota archaeon]|nr:hypothetical protein [Candidatus Pacearchaeota archaeon]